MPSLKDKEEYLFVVNSKFKTNHSDKTFSNEKIDSVGDWDLTVYRDTKSQPRTEFDALCNEGKGISTQQPVTNLSSMFQLMAIYFEHPTTAQRLHVNETEFITLFGPLCNFLVLRHDGNCTKVTCEDEHYVYAFVYWTS